MLLLRYHIVTHITLTPALHIVTLALPWIPCQKFTLTQGRAFKKKTRDQIQQEEEKCHPHNTIRSDGRILRPRLLLAMSGTRLLSQALLFGKPLIFVFAFTITSFCFVDKNYYDKRQRKQTGITLAHATKWFFIHCFGVNWMNLSFGITCIVHLSYQIIRESLDHAFTGKICRILFELFNGVRESSKAYKSFKIS